MSVSLSAPWQIAISVVVSLHLLAVFLPPLTMASRTAGGASPLAQPLYQAMLPYIDALYLNHGYFFFAPEPGPSHLVRYEADLGSGKSPIVGQLPDRTTQWPRLLYHRHFMMTETLTQFYEPLSFGRPKPTPPVSESRLEEREYKRALEAWENEERAWQIRRTIYESLGRSFTEHLKKEYGANEVLLIRRQHRIVSPQEYFDDGVRLTDEETYRNLPEVPPAEEVAPWNRTPIQ